MLVCVNVINGVLKQKLLSLYPRQKQEIYGRFLERKIWTSLTYVADRLKKLRGSGQLYLVNVNLVFNTDKIWLTREP